MWAVSGGGLPRLSGHFVFVFVHLKVAILSSGSGTLFHGYLFVCSVISSTVIGPFPLKIFYHLDPDKHLFCPVLCLHLHIVLILKSGLYAH